MLPDNFPSVFKRLQNIAEGAIAHFDDMFKAGKNPFINPEAYVPKANKNTVRPSSMLYCHRKAGFEHHKVAITNPNAEESKDTLFRTGNVFGHMWASAFVNFTKTINKDNKFYGIDEKWKASIEVESLFKEANIAGKADIIVTLPSGEKVIIECKSSEGKARRSIGDFKEAYLYQTASYMMAHKTNYGMVIVQSKWRYTFYYIEYFELLQTFRVYDKNGEEISCFINLSDLYAEAGKIMIAREKVVKGNYMDVPFEGAEWECVSRVKPGILGNSKRPPEPSVLIPACRYCALCYPGLIDGNAMLVDKIKPDPKQPWVYDESSKRIVTGYTYEPVDEESEDE